jgi:hypothetical protein
MAFLDNSGDIILDAVLTDLGRQKMAAGTFKIAKYAFGDDEVDYGLYNKNHPSGSAYYDLEILQTPSFEAFVYSGAGINYGLASFTNTNLLYLPSLKQNEKIKTAVLMTNSLYYLGVNQETVTALQSGLGNKQKVLENNNTAGYAIVVESGLDTTDLVGDASNRSSYIVANNLLDSTYSVFFDNRFLANVLSPTAQSVFKNTSTGADATNLILSTTTATSRATGMDNYSVSSARGVNDLVYYVTNGTGVATSVSAIAGPRGSATAASFKVVTGLDASTTGTTDAKYTRYGKTGQDLGFSDGYTYDYIDTTVLIVGATTNATYMATVRITRRAS